MVRLKHANDEKSKTDSFRHIVTFLTLCLINTLAYTYLLRTFLLIVSTAVL